MLGRRSSVRRTCAAAVTLFAALTALVGHSQGAPARFLILDTTFGLAFVAAGTIAWKLRPEVRTGPVLVASGALWFVGSYAPTALVGWGTLGFAFERYYDVTLAFLVLTFPDTRLTRRDNFVLGVLTAGFVARTVSRLLVDCVCGGPRNPFAIVANLRLFEGSQFVTSAMIAVAALGVAVRAVLRLTNAAPAARRILWPVVASGALAALVAAYDAVELMVFVRTHRPLLPFAEPWLEIASWTIIASAAVISLGFLAGALRLRLRHGSIAKMAIELDRGTDPQRLQASLRHALGDPALELYLRGTDGMWATDNGPRGDLPTENSHRAVTILSDDDEPLAAVVHDRTLREDPGLVAAATAVLRLAIENERLAGVVRGQLEEVRASRSRLVRAAEKERRRIERDLHDGAQQRLIAVALTLQQTREQTRRGEPASAVLRSLDTAAEELIAAVNELRELARGIHPAILTAEGLRPALAGLARRSTVPVELDLHPVGRLASSVEAAAYYIVAEALTNVARHARASSAVVHIAKTNGFLLVEVSDDGEGGADASRGSGLSGIADRLDALAGTLNVQSPLGVGTRLRASIPCV